MEEGDNFEGERVIVDAHVEKISNILDCLYILRTPIKPSNGVVDDPHHHINRRLAHIDNRLERISDEQKDVKSGPGVECCFLKQLEEQLIGLKLELFDVSQNILALTEDTTVLTDKETRISKGIFDACLHIRRLLSTTPPITPAVTASSSTDPTAKKERTRLPKIEVPKFD